MAKTLDLTDKIFGKLTVVKFSHVNELGKRCWLCHCSCGKFTKVMVQSLQCGNTRSCGCGMVEAATTHGGYGTPEYRSWQGAVARCENENLHNFSDYGGRGITICPRWRGDKGFENFLADMGPKPTPQHSLDRVEVDGNYEPENCRWATKQEQVDNRRSFGRIETFSDEALIAELNRRTPEYGLSGC